jgi:Helix-turn-helix domain of resolvase
LARASDLPSPPKRARARGATKGACLLQWPRLAKVRELLSAGVSKAEIARTLKIAESSVYRILAPATAGGRSSPPSPLTHLREQYQLSPAICSRPGERPESARLPLPSDLAKVT